MRCVGLINELLNLHSNACSNAHSRLYIEMGGTRGREGLREAQSLLHLRIDSGRRSGHSCRSCIPIRDETMRKKERVKDENLLVCSHCHTAAIARLICLMAHLLPPPAGFALLFPPVSVYRVIRCHTCKTADISAWPEFFKLVLGELGCDMDALFDDSGIFELTLTPSTLVVSQDTLWQSQSMMLTECRESAS